VGSLVTLFNLADDLGRAPRNFTEAQRLDTARFGRMHAGCLERGHALPASQFEALFASTTHTDEMIDGLADAVRAALAAEAGR
jgi:glutamate-1-semialdehyde 2,1-aminomutase